MGKQEIQTVEAYIESFPDDTAQKLRELRALVMECVPDVEEKLSWGAPTYYLDGYLLQFAAYQKHIGFYTTPAVIQHFASELLSYETNKKNTMKLPLSFPLPMKLLKRMILFRVEEHQSSKKQKEN